MCYLVAKKADGIGSIALQTSHGQHLVDFKKKIIKEIGVENIQLVTISRPSAYGEYEPYRFVDTEQEFEENLKLLYHIPCVEYFFYIIWNILSGS